MRTCTHTLFSLTELTELTHSFTEKAHSSLHSLHSLHSLTSLTQNYLLNPFSVFYSCQDLKGLSKERTLEVAREIVTLYEEKESTRLAEAEQLEAKAGTGQETDAPDGGRGTEKTEEEEEVGLEDQEQAKKERTRWKRALKVLHVLS